MKKIFISLCVLAICLVFVANKQESNTIIVYSSLEQFRQDELQKQLNEQFPDLNVYVMYMTTAKAAAKLRIEKDKSDADIFVGLETSYITNFEDSLADISSYSRLNYLEGLSPADNNNKFVTWERQAGAILVNKDILKKYNLEAPTSYDDLLDPQYQGLIAMPDPKSSGTGYFFYKSMVNSRGEAAALEYFDALEKNIKQFPTSGSGPVKLLIQGEVAIGLALTFQGVNEINKGQNFEIIYPEEGSPFSLTGTGMLKGREDNEDVKRVFDFIVNDFIKYDKEYFSPEQIFVDQPNTIDNYPENIKYADMTGIDSIEVKNHLISVWKY